jgi:hypothetical protein
MVRFVTDLTDDHAIHANRFPSPVKASVALDPSNDATSFANVRRGIVKDWGGPNKRAFALYGSADHGVQPGSSADDDEAGTAECLVL